MEVLCKTESCTLPVQTGSGKAEYCCVKCKRGTGEHGASCFSNRSMVVAEVVHLCKTAGRSGQSAESVGQLCEREGCGFPRHPGLGHGYCCNICKTRGGEHGSSCTARQHGSRANGMSLHSFDEQTPLVGKADAGGQLGGQGWRKGDGVCASAAGEDVSIVWRLHRPDLPVPSDKLCPVVVFFHGSGERGYNNHAQIGQASRMLEGLPEACFVIATQCPLERRWVEVHWGDKSHNLPVEPSVALTATMHALDELLKTACAPAADPTRVYLAGLSMGGFAVWDALTRWPGRFAGALSMAGGADNRAILDSVGPPQLPPVWAFHGSRDTIVKPERSDGAIDALRKAGISEEEARYTVFNGQSHGIWNHVFDDASIGVWLFSHRRPHPDAPVETILAQACVTAPVQLECT
mmetsp:Transcript_146310/g.469340  ORF Transcript_146310/g.469340 Transcript_146310/m.469340 type:complete len:407 (+) Transcript_146310:148-1368(+)